MSKRNYGDLEGDDIDESLLNRPSGSDTPKEKRTRNTRFDHKADRKAQHNDDPMNVTYGKLFSTIIGDNASNSRLDPDMESSSVSYGAAFDAKESEVEVEDDWGQDNIGGDNKQERAKKFFGFKGEKLFETIKLTGRVDVTDVDEKSQIQRVLEKINSAKFTDQEEAKKILSECKNKEALKTHCRVCDILNTDIYSPDNHEIVSAIEAIQRYDLSTCGYAQELQLLHTMTQKFNEIQLKRANGRGVQILFTTDEVVHCFKNHNKMNLKRTLLEGIHLANEIKWECAMHVKGVAEDGRRIFNLPEAKHVFFFHDKEVSYQKDLIGYDMALRQAGVIKSSIPVTKNHKEKGNRYDTKTNGVLRSKFFG